MFNLYEVCLPQTCFARPTIKFQVLYQFSSVYPFTCRGIGCLRFSGRYIVFRLVAGAYYHRSHVHLSIRKSESPEVGKNASVN